LRIDQLTLFVDLCTDKVQALVPYLKQLKNLTFMFIQTIKAVPVIAFIFISSAASASGSEPTPAATAHIQVSVRQMDPNSMKFRVAVFNPFTKGATITICRGEDVLYTESGVRGEYQNLFNLDQLEDGNYQIIITSGKETISKDINIHTQTTTDREARVN
jgi:hypothetical protein